MGKKKFWVEKKTDWFGRKVEQVHEEDPRFLGGAQDFAHDVRRYHNTIISFPGAKTLLGLLFWFVIGCALFIVGYQTLGGIIVSPLICGLILTYFIGKMGLDVSEMITYGLVFIVFLSGGCALIFFICSKIFNISLPWAFGIGGIFVFSVYIWRVIVDFIAKRGKSGLIFLPVLLIVTTIAFIEDREKRSSPVVQQSIGQKVQTAQTSSIPQLQSKIPQQQQQSMFQPSKNQEARSVQKTAQAILMDECKTRMEEFRVWFAQSSSKANDSQLKTAHENFQKWTTYCSSNIQEWQPPFKVQPVQATTLNWGCDARPPDLCYFSIYYHTGESRNFTMTAGQRDQISGIMPGKDAYCVTVNQGFPNSNTCPRRIVKPSYNN